MLGRHLTEFDFLQTPSTQVSSNIENISYGDSIMFGVSCIHQFKGGMGGLRYPLNCLLKATLPHIFKNIFQEISLPFPP